MNKKETAGNFEPKKWDVEDYIVKYPNGTGRSYINQLVSKELLAPQNLNQFVCWYSHVLLHLMS